MESWRLKNYKERTLICDELKKIYPDRISIIVDRANKYQPKIYKNKFLAKQDMRICEFIIIIKNKIIIRNPAQVGIFLFCGNTLLQGHITLGELYDKYRSRDGAVYIYYQVEAEFGSIHFNIQYY